MLRRLTMAALLSGSVLFAVEMALSGTLHAADPCNDLRENIATLTEEAGDLVNAIVYMESLNDPSLDEWIALAEDELLDTMNQVAAWRDQYAAMYCFE